VAIVFGGGGGRGGPLENLACGNSSRKENPIQDLGISTTNWTKTAGRINPKRQYMI